MMALNTIFCCYLFFFLTKRSRRQCLSSLKVPANREFPRCLVPPCQNEYSCENHSSENVFRVQVDFHANQTWFYMKCFARRLVSKQRHKVTRKWVISNDAIPQDQNLTGLIYIFGVEPEVACNSG